MCAAAAGDSINVWLQVVMHTMRAPLTAKSMLRLVRAQARPTRLACSPSWPWSGPCFTGSARLVRPLLVCERMPCTWLPVAAAGHGAAHAAHRCRARTAHPAHVHAMPHPCTHTHAHAWRGAQACTAPSPLPWRRCWWRCPTCSRSPSCTPSSPTRSCALSGQVCARGSSRAAAARRWGVQLVPLSWHWPSS
jgi:hypothetical protein